MRNPFVPPFKIEVQNPIGTTKCGTIYFCDSHEPSFGGRIFSLPFSNIKQRDEIKKMYKFMMKKLVDKPNGGLNDKDQEKKL